MKNKILVLSILLILSSFLFSEDKKTDSQTIKKIVDKSTEEVKVEIKRPDNTAVMSRKKTIFTDTVILDLKDKIKKSNKLLY